MSSEYCTWIVTIAHEFSVWVLRGLANDYLPVVVVIVSIVLGFLHGLVRGIFRTLIRRKDNHF